MKTPDDQFRDWEGDTFGYGYGTGEPFTLAALKGFFDLLEGENGKYWHVKLEENLTPTVAWLMIDTLCQADIIEYGTSPRGGWLTEQGRKLRKYLQDKTVEQLCEIVSADEHYTHCGRDYCNCDPPNNHGKQCVSNEFF